MRARARAHTRTHTHTKYIYIKIRLCREYHDNIGAFRFTHKSAFIYKHVRYIVDKCAHMHETERTISDLTCSSVSCDILLKLRNIKNLKIILYIRVCQSNNLCLWQSTIDNNCLASVRRAKKKLPNIMMANDFKTITIFCK